jgi:competence transcription factor ComK
MILLKVHPKDPDNPNRIAYINPEGICIVHDQKMGGSLISFSNGETMTVHESPDALATDVHNPRGEPSK